MADDLFGFKIREQLYPGEDTYFKSNPHVGGMAAESNDIILNPYSPPEVNKDAVAKNEAYRLHMKKRGVVPDFELTDEQRKSFVGTPYESDEPSLKSTIAARIYSGDPSARETPEQRAWVEQDNRPRSRLRIGNKTYGHK